MSVLLYMVICVGRSRRGVSGAAAEDPISPAGGVPFAAAAAAAAAMAAALADAAEGSGVALVVMDSELCISPVSCE
jgi:hypothetical protein